MTDTREFIDGSLEVDTRDVAQVVLKAALDIGVPGVDFNEGDLSMPGERSHEPLEVKIVGRISYGEGLIDGAECDEGFFRRGLEFLRDKGLTTLDSINAKRRELGKKAVASILDIFGNCMDGRRNKMTLAGGLVEMARPKVMGGPVLFLTYLQTLTGNLKDDNLLSTFTQNAENNKFGASMHEGCGAARGFDPVLRKFATSFDEINDMLGRLTSEDMRFSDSEKQFLLANIENGLQIAAAQKDEFTEANMIQAIVTISGADAVLQFEVDETHPTHSHDESGIVYLMGAEGHDYIMVKDAVYDNSDVPNMFYQNAAYAKRLVKENFGRMHPQLILAQKLALALPLAAIGVLGKNQWVGSVGNYEDMHGRMVA